MKLTWTFSMDNQQSQDLPGDLTHALNVAEANPGKAVVQEIEGPGVYAVRALKNWDSHDPNRGPHWTGWYIRTY